jgi:prepilin-type N-terminal cleavage/methylation domain-containing protein
MPILKAGISHKVKLRNNFRNAPGECGLTLIELIVALALLAGLTGAITVSLTRYEARHNLDLAFHQLVAELRLAELTAESSGNESRVYFDIENGTYCIWSKDSSGETSDGDGSAPESSAVAGDTNTLPRKITLNAINYPESSGLGEETPEDSGEEGWPDGSDWIAFYPDRTATAAEIELDSSDGKSRKVQIKTGGWIGEIVDAAE